ncbi:MAG: aspartate aminotransferase family protein [Polymorphobacter sp.]|uniref:aspartate aminotransferase family protein n=1 Tax=Polymorphobacter sp. TaxID=1909290 RepID=UPI003A842F38
MRPGINRGTNSVGDAFWMPFTDNRYFKANPRLLARAEGMHYWTPDGRQLLDGTAGLWCVNAGHGRTRIVEAIQAQAAALDFAPTFQLGHPLAFEAAERVAALMPEGLNRIFFANSGSEAVDTALKIALAVQRARGQGSRTRLIGRERGYHGTGFGGLSVGGIMPNRRAFGPGLPGVDHLPHTHDLVRNAFSRGQPVHGAERADALEALVQLHGADTIAAVIVEPLAGSTGVLVPPVGYLQRLREICTRHGILLIFDEVITGFGRLGAATASQAFGVTPDMICLAKGITNGAVPMGAVACHQSLHDTLIDAPGDAPGIELFHGYTYSAHPLACAASLATLDVYEEDGLFARAASLAAHWEEAVHRLAGAPHVIDVRNMGLVAGIEIAPDPNAPGARGQALFRALFDSGLLARATADILALSPPLIVSSEQIDEMVAHVAKALEAMK